MIKGWRKGGAAETEKGTTKGVWDSSFRDGVWEAESV